jgi:hypothetical protein
LLRVLGDADAVHVRLRQAHLRARVSLIRRAMVQLCGADRIFTGGARACSARVDASQRELGCRHSLYNNVRHNARQK